MRKIVYCPVVGGQCSQSEPKIKVQEDTFFLAEPFRPEQEKKRREQAVKSALKDALGLDSSEKRLRIADREPTETAIFCDICRMIQSSTYGIVDLSGLNPNVLIELGMMFSLSKPVFVLIKESDKKKLKEQLPSNIDWKRVIPYEEFVDIEEKLSRQIQNRPQVEPEPSLVEQAKEVLSEVYPEFAQKIDSMLQEIKRDQEQRLDKLEGLLERTGLGESIPQEHEIKIPSSLERQIKDLCDKIERMEKLIGPPENSKTAILRGNWHYHKKEYEKALEFYEWALALKPSSQAAWYNKGIALSKLGKHEEAITCFDKAIQIKEDFEKAWYSKGIALGKLGKHEEAITCFDKAIQIKEDFEKAWYSKGIALDKLGKHEEAIACYDKAIEINPNDLSTLMNLSEALLILGDLTKGLETAKRAFNLAEEARDKAICQFLFISAYLLRNENKKAQKELKRLITSSEKLKSPIVSGWDFCPLLPTIEERLKRKHKEILLSLMSFLKGEIEVGEFEKRLGKTFKESQAM